MFRSIHALIVITGPVLWALLEASGKRGFSNFINSQNGTQELLPVQARYAGDVALNYRWLQSPLRWHGMSDVFAYQFCSVQPSPKRKCVGGMICQYT